MATMSSIDMAYKTAITRKTLSSPAKRLRDGGYLLGRVLDYGCGRGKDADELGCEGYDPHWRPSLPVGKFDTIMCNYVLNVIESDKVRRDVLADIAGLLTDDGVAYIAVRNDRAALKGLTKIGTWQGRVILALPIIHKGSDCVIYKLCKGDESCLMVTAIF
jgi:SAM-dependent methyltransferase